MRQEPRHVELNESEIHSRQLKIGEASLLAPKAEIGDFDLRERIVERCFRLDEQAAKLTAGFQWTDAWLADAIQYAGTTFEPFDDFTDGDFVGRARELDAAGTSREGVDIAVPDELLNDFDQMILGDVERVGDLFGGGLAAGEAEVHQGSKCVIGLQSQFHF